MDFYVLISLIISIVAIFFGSFVFSKNRKATTNRTFFLMSISVAIWSFAYAKWISIPFGFESDALFWSRLLNFGATFIPIFFLHCTLSILNIAKEKRKVLTFGYLITLIFAIFSFSPIYISSVKQVSVFPYWPQAGILYTFYIIIGYFGLTGYGVYQLIRAKKNADKEKNHQINYSILGALFGFIGGATNFPLMFGFGINPLVGQSAVVFFYYFFGVATIKYHLFEIKLILTEVLIGVMGIILVILPFFMPTNDLRILTSIVLSLFIIFGYYLIKANHEEVVRKEEAERVSNLKTEFISIASHQLRTPLGAIRGYSSMFQEGDYGKMSDEAMTAIHYISEASIRMINLVNNLLSVSRLEKGLIELKIQDVSIEEVIENCIKDTELAIKAKGLSLKYKKSKSHLPIIKGDPEKLKEAFNNIISNAIIYTEKGEIAISLKTQGKCIFIKITDTGIGIEKEEFAKLFKSFSRGKSGVEKYTQGTGLGLYIAKNFLEMHKGDLRAESKGKDKGSTFLIRLPINSTLETYHKFVLSDQPS
ncbi:MAG: ATP-binding protein [Candidatus Paceibacterota bacterium]